MAQVGMGIMCGDGRMLGGTGRGCVSQQRRGAHLTLVEGGWLPQDTSSSSFHLQISPLPAALIEVTVPMVV